MCARFKHLLGNDAGGFVQFVKYAIAGGLATGVHVSVFFLLGWGVFPCLQPDDLSVKLVRLFADVSPAAVEESARAFNAGVCNVSAFIVSNAFCYVLNRAFVFKPGRHAPVVEALLFFAVSGLSMAVGTALAYCLIRFLGLQTAIAFIANLVSSLAINYVMRRFVVFKG
jgi:putative flippase GtrA